MSTCYLTSGDAVPCKDSPGGIKSVRIIEWEYLNDGTLTVVSGVASTITPGSAKKFWKYNLPNQNQDYFNEPVVTNNQTGIRYFAPEVQITLRKLRIELRNEILLLTAQRTAMIVETHEGTYWLLGAYNGLDSDNSNIGSGAGRDAFAGYQLKFSGQEETPMIEVPSALIAALTN